MWRKVCPIAEGLLKINESIHSSRAEISHKSRKPRNRKILDIRIRYFS